MTQNAFQSGHPTRAFRPRLLASLLAAAALCAGCGPPGDVGSDELPGDRVLIARLGDERTSFDSLVTMLGEDPEIRRMSGFAEYVDTGGPTNSYHAPGSAQPGLSAERWNTYERLLRRVGVGHAVEVDANGILFLQSARKDESPEHCWLRGYWYARRAEPRARRPEDLETLADSSIVPRQSDRLPYFRPIGGRWFLYTFRGYN